MFQIKAFQQGARLTALDEGDPVARLQLVRRQANGKPWWGVRREEEFQAQFLIDVLFEIAGPAHSDQFTLAHDAHALDDFRLYSPTLEDLYVHYAA